MSEEQFKELAAREGVSVEAVRTLVTALCERAGGDYFYVFATGGNGGQAATSRRQRFLLAFLTPDAALAFAQRQHLTGGAQLRLRRLSMFQLIHAAILQPSIVALLIVDEADDLPAMIGGLPKGTRIDRAEILQRLHAQAI